MVHFCLLWIVDVLLMFDRTSPLCASGRVVSRSDAMARALVVVHCSSTCNKRGRTFFGIRMRQQPTSLPGRAEEVPWRPFEDARTAKKTDSSDITPHHHPAGLRHFHHEQPQHFTSATLFFHRRDSSWIYTACSSASPNRFGSTSAATTTT